METYDKIIIGAGLYGLYAAIKCSEKKEKVLVLEYEDTAFVRATKINQARVHQGYHYPRSISTAIKSAGYFDRFNKDYNFCINKEFKQIYATSDRYSWTNREQFLKFCDAAGILCEEINVGSCFKDYMCDGAFITREYTYDADLLKEYYLSKIQNKKNIDIQYGARIHKIEKDKDFFVIYTEDKKSYMTGYVLNVTYAGVNNILNMAGFDGFDIKYELCEIILCEANENLKEYGFTVMDGPFFSIMPYGKTGLHSLTSVTFTPHEECHTFLPEFKCQRISGNECGKKSIKNCNVCPYKPETSYSYMSGLVKKYLRDEFLFKYKNSLFTIKPVLMSSEIDDSRPTVIKFHSKSPTFISVLSGKINTVYDLDEVL